MAVSLRINPAAAQADPTPYYSADPARRQCQIAANAAFFQKQRFTCFLIIFGDTLHMPFACSARRAVHAHDRLDAGNTVSQTAEVTRYPNRRLYDRSQRQYVTLGDIEEMVRNGKNVRVRDSKTEEDLTRVILTQILLERHPERLQMFPVALLHEILRADQMALDWLTVYLGQAKNFIETLPSTTAADFVPGMDLWKLWMPGSAGQADPPNDVAASDVAASDVAASKDAPSEATPEDDQQSDNQRPGSEKEMAKRLAELERRLNELESNRD